MVLKHTFIGRCNWLLVATLSNRARPGTYPYPFHPVLHLGLRNGISSLLLTRDTEKHGWRQLERDQMSSLQVHVWCCCMKNSPCLPRANHYHRSSAGSEHEVLGWCFCFSKYLFILRGERGRGRPRDHDLSQNKKWDAYPAVPPRRPLALKPCF